MGGNPNVVIAEPDIKTFKVDKTNDFIVLASDGVYDQMESREAMEVIWKNLKGDNLHKACAEGVDSLLNDAIIK